VTNKGISGKALFLLDRLTDMFPRTVPQMFQKVFLSTVGSPSVFRVILAWHRRKLRRVRTIDSVLILADVGIGDAIMVQQSVVAMRSLHPSARIDYVCNRPAGELLLALPQVDNVYPLFDGHGIPSESSYEAINDITSRTSYSLVLNFSPFLDTRRLRSASLVLDLYIPFATYVVRLWSRPEKQRHISTVMRMFLREYFSESKRVPDPAEETTRSLTGSPSPFTGNDVYLSDASIDEAEAFIRSGRISFMDRLVFFNADSSSRYGYIPSEIQHKLLRQLGESTEVGGILIGEAYTQEGAERRLLAGLPEAVRRRCVIVPHLPLATFAAVLDWCDVIVSGDGGPVHLAAAWKLSVSGNRTLRNRTAVFTVFGGTDSRMYGYDSEREGHVAAAQWAPSSVFNAPAPCRNITCVDKLGKTCSEVRCFSGLQAEQISHQVLAYLQSTSRLRHSA
jgi:ADP-heptose:LPS heptosyltransferase